MATILTKQNLANIFDRISEQFDTLKAAQDILYTAIRASNIDLSSHYSFRAEADIEAPLMTALQNYREYIKTYTTEYTEFGNYPEFRNLFNAFSTYFRTETVLTDKTINGFMAYNDLKVSDKVNKIYQGITGSYLQAQNVLPPEDFQFAQANPRLVSFLPSSVWTWDLNTDFAGFSNATYVPTSTAGNMYTPFPIKIVPRADVTGIVFKIIWSDNVEETFDFSSSTLPATGYYVTTYHPGIKSIEVISGGGNIGNRWLKFYTNFTYVKLLSPLGWCNPTDADIQAYIEDLNGIRLLFGNTQFIPKTTPSYLYLRMKPSNLGDLNGTFFIGNDQLPLGTPDVDGWYVNDMVEITPTQTVTVQAKSIEVAPLPPESIAYQFVSTIDGDLSNPNNYDPVGTPTSIDTVEIQYGTGPSYLSGSVTCETLTFYAGINTSIGTEINADVILNESVIGISLEGLINGNLTVSAPSTLLTPDLTVNGNVEVLTSATLQCSVNGTVSMFSDSTQSGSLLNSANGAIVFYDSSKNTGSITGNCTFNGYSYNDTPGIITGTATFNDYAQNLGFVNTLAVFNGQASASSGCYLQDATFNDTSVNYTGYIAGNAKFYGSSYNDVEVWPSNAEFHDSSYNSSNGNVFTAKFYDTSSNAGTISGTAFYYPGGSIGSWTYPTNTGTIITAEIYWLQVDNDLGGTITNENYNGYI